MKNGLHLRTSSHLGAQNVERGVLVFSCVILKIAIGFSIKNVPSFAAAMIKNGGFVICACWNRAEHSGARRAG